MKSVLIIVCVILITPFSSPDVLANEIQDGRAVAAKHYRQGNFKKAYRKYYKLARSGDIQSQHKVSQMNASGKGTNVDLAEAYAWAALAADGGHQDALNTSRDLLQQIEDEDEAREKAAKLKKKYSRDALRKKADRIAKRQSGKQSHKCTGSRIGC